jgi:hypothetical protein
VQIVAWHGSTRFQPWSFYTCRQRDGHSLRDHSQLPGKHGSTVRTEHRLEAYANAVASSLKVHGDSSRDRSKRSLGGPENNVA